MLRSFASLLLLALALLALPFQSRAQALEIDIVGGNAAALPITVPVRARLAMVINLEAPKSTKIILLSLRLLLILAGLISR